MTPVGLGIPNRRHAFNGESPWLFFCPYLKSSGYVKVIRIEYNAINSDSYHGGKPRYASSRPTLKIHKLTPSSGLGKGLTVRYLAMPDVTVIATMRETSAANTFDLESVPKGPNSHLIITQLDQGDSVSVTDAICTIEKKHLINHVDLVIANAGIANHWGPVSELNESDMISHFQVNTLGPLRLFTSILHLLKAGLVPKFIYLSSELASLSRLDQSSSLTAAYGASKVAGNYLIRKIHEEEPDLVAFSIDPG